MKLRSNPHTKKTLVIICSFVLIGIIVFYATYYFFIKKSLYTYENNIKLTIENITKINDSTSSFTKGQTIDTEKILKELPGYISSLKSNEQTLKNIKVPDRYSASQENLIKGLRNNVSLYEEIYIICKDPESKNLKNNLNSIYKYRDDCMAKYSLVSVNDLKITLSKNCMDFINNSIFFIETQLNKNIDNQLSLMKNKNFFNSFDIIIRKFNPIPINFSEKIYKVREKKSSYSELISTITSTEASVNNIKGETSNIIIPKDYTALYDAFTKTLKDYNSYIQDLKYAIKTENLASGSNLTDSALSKLYESSNKKFKTFSINYDNFTKNYDNLKTQFKKNNST